MGWGVGGGMEEAGLSQSHGVAVIGEGQQVGIMAASGKGSKLAQA